MVPRPPPQHRKQRFAISQHASIAEIAFQVVRQLACRLVALVRHTGHGFEANRLHARGILGLTSRGRLQRPNCTLPSTSSSVPRNGGSPVSRW